MSTKVTNEQTNTAGNNVLYIIFIFQYYIYILKQKTKKTF